MVELAEWWEDVCDGGIGSRVVVVEVPAGWGALAVLEEFSALVSVPDGPVRILVSVGDVPMVNRAVEAGALRAALRSPFARPEADRAVFVRSAGRVVQLLGLDSVAGEVQLGLGIGGLFASGAATAAGLLLGSLAVTAAGNAWDSSAAGQQGDLARAARALAAVSVAAPVAVVIADADRLDLDLAVVMIENLVGRPDGRVLVIVVTEPHSALADQLGATHRYWLVGRVRVAEADPAMGHSERADLVRELCPWLPAAGINRIARRTRDFAEVFAVCAAGRLTDLADGSNPVEVADVVDVVIEACRVPEEVPRIAVMLGWAGGVLTTSQAELAMQALGLPPGPGENAWVSRSGGLVRLHDPDSAQVADQVAALGSQTRRELAGAVLAGATDIARAGTATLVERTVARLAAHRVRRDLPGRDGLAEVQYLLVQGLDQLGDRAAARQVADAALTELPVAERDTKPARDLRTAVLRLASSQPTADDPVIQDAVAEAEADSPLFGLEARVWAAVHLLNRPGRRDAATALTGQVAARLARLPSRDETANQWRTLLAFHAGRAGDPALAHQILGPAINGGTPSQQAAAQAVLRAIGGPQADTRLQIIMLQAEITATPASAAGQLLHLHRVLAQDYDTLGDHHSALRHSITWHQLSAELLGADHPNTLDARFLVATSTGRSGDAAEALRLFRELLPDQIRALGANNPHTLTTRNNIATWTGECGDRAEALRLLRKLLPDQIRALGADHNAVLATRSNIAVTTGECGDAAKAQRLARELLPDQIRVLGADNLQVLLTRGNIAAWTGQCGDAAKALRLARELLQDQIRVLGADHPNVFITRNNIAGLTGQCGDAAKALRLARELLPDQIQMLGIDNTYFLITRINFAKWTGVCGATAEALRLFWQLLPDQIRVLGDAHPSVLTTRSRIAALRR